LRLFGGVLFGSKTAGFDEAKSVVANVYPVSSLVVTVESRPTGAAPIWLTFSDIVFAVADRSTPKLAVPPLSCTWNVKDASGLPNVPVGGVYVSWWLMMLSIEMS